jgi:hypothetical protein
MNRLGNTVVLIVLPILIASFLATRSLAQTRAVEEGDQFLHADDLSAQDKLRLQALHEGKALSPSDTKLLDKAAQWFVYRVTWKKYQEREPVDGVSLSTGRSVYDILQKDLYPLLIVPDPARPTWKPNQAQFEYMQAFTKALIPHIDKVLQNPRAIARINAALILVKLSESGQEQLLDPLVKILEDNDQHDAIKFQVLVALANVFKGDPFVDPEIRGFLDHEKEGDAIKAIVNFLEKRKPPEFSRTKRPSTEELEAFKYVRRQAIRTLGFVRQPIVAKRKIVISRPALALLKVVAKDGFMPPPSLSEQVEAAISLCQLQFRLVSDYNVDYAVAQLGKFLVQFGDDYEKERAQPSKTQSWKYDAAILGQALQAFQKEGRDSKNVDEFAKLGSTMCKSIVEGGQASGLRDLKAWVDNHQAPGGTLYRSQPDSTVKESQATERPRGRP